MTRIRGTLPAIQDLTKICDYIEGHGTPGAARRVGLIIYQSIQTLRKLPNRGRPGRKLGARELVLTNLPYIIVYRVHKAVVEILRILHGAQNRP